MFNLFKKSEFEIISQKIKYKNHKITEALDKTKFKNFSKLNQKKQKDYLRKLIESLSGSDFAQSLLAYSFNFDEIPMFSFLLNVNENDYGLSIYGKDDFLGFQCDYLLSDNVFRLTLKDEKEAQEDKDDFKKLIGKETFDITSKIIQTSFETTKKAKKLYKEMISTSYLNDFSYNLRKKNPIIA